MTTQFSLPYLDETPEAQEPDVDLGKIVAWERLMDRMHEVNRISAHAFLRDFNKAMAYCSDKLSAVNKKHAKAYANRKSEWAQAMLGRSVDYLNAKGIKITDKAKEAYADMDEAYLKAVDEEARYEALSTYLKGKVELFRSAHDDARALLKSDTPIVGDGGMTSIPD